jgi:hypothetical protein
MAGEEVQILEARAVEGQDRHLGAVAAAVQMVEEAAAEGLNFFMRYQNRSTTQQALILLLLDQARALPAPGRSPPTLTATLL